MKFTEAQLEKVFIDLLRDEEIPYVLGGEIQRALNHASLAGYSHSILFCLAGMTLVFKCVCPKWTQS